MNGIELYVLGRRLMKLGEAAMPRAGFRQLPASVQLVLVDLSDHPDSSITQIVGRTGLPQSAVSDAVARLKRARVLTTRTDPADGRRTLVRPAADLKQRAAQAPAEDIDSHIGNALGRTDPAEIAAVIETLADLARRFDTPPEQGSDTSPGQKRER